MNLLHMDRGDFCNISSIPIAVRRCDLGSDHNDSENMNQRSPSPSRSPANAYVHSLVDQWSEGRSVLSRVTSNASTASKQLLPSPTTECVGSFLLPPFQLADNSPQLLTPLRSIAASTSDYPIDWSLVSGVAPKIQADGTTSGYVNSIRHQVRHARPADHVRSISSSADVDDFDLPYIFSARDDQLGDQIPDEIPDADNNTIEAMTETDGDYLSPSEDSSMEHSTDGRLVDSITRLRLRLAPQALAPTDHQEVSGTGGQYHYRFRRSNSILAIGRTSSPSTSSMDIDCDANCVSIYGPELTPSCRQWDAALSTERDVIHTL